MKDEALRLLLVDDHPLVREGLRALLSSLSNMAVAGEASDGEEANRRILQLSPHIGILVLTMLGDDDSVFGAMRAGARGYLLKGAGKEEVLRAITVVTHGEAIFSPQIAQRLMQYFSTMRPSIPEHAFPDLTEREREVLTLIVAGKSNTQIAQTLVLSPKTVSNHISNIFSKLQVVDRAQAIAKARRDGSP